MDELRDCDWLEVEEVGRGAGMSGRGVWQPVREGVRGPGELKRLWEIRHKNGRERRERESQLFRSTVEQLDDSPLIDGRGWGRRAGCRWTDRCTPAVSLLPVGGGFRSSAWDSTPHGPAIGCDRNQSQLQCEVSQSVHGGAAVWPARSPRGCRSRLQYGSSDLGTPDGARQRCRWCSILQ